MSDKRQLNHGGTATARKLRIVFVGGVVADHIAEQFRDLDWEVLNVPTGNDLACAVLARRPSAVLLPVDTGWESAFLVAAKLRASRRKPKVVIVAHNHTAEAARFAKFVGAVLVPDADGATRMLHAVTGD